MLGTSTAIHPYVNSYATSSQYKNKSMPAEGFEDKVGAAVTGKNMANKKYASSSGNMVISQPPVYRHFDYDNTLDSKSKEEMSMDEYKQWVMGKISQMPVSAWYSSTCVGGSLVITQEAFEKMKSDPEWENTVMNMVRKMYSTNGIMGSKMIGFQVIGASPEECYGEGIPVNKNSGSSTASKDGKSWWIKRHEKMEELMEEQIAKLLQRRQERNEQVKNDYMKQFYHESKNMSYLPGTNSFEKKVQEKNPASIVAAYEKNSIVLSDEFI